MLNVKKNDLKIRLSNMSLPAKASIAFVLCNFMQRGITVLTTPIFTRLMTTEQFGYYSIFNSWLDIISVFTTLKLAGGVFTQALIKFDNDRDSFTSCVAGLGTILSSLFLIIYLIFEEKLNIILGINRLTMICIIFASWASLIYELWATRQRVEYKYKLLVLLTIIISIMKPLFGIITVVATPVYKAEARILSLTIVEMICYSGIFIIFIKKGKKLFDRTYWRYCLRLNIPLIPHYLTRTVLNQCDRLMIQAMIGYSSAGIYSLAYNLAWMLNLITSSILNTFNPWMYQKIKNKEYSEIGAISYCLLTLIAVLAIMFISIAPEIIKIFAPQEYYQAIWVIPPVTVSVYFLFMYSLFANFEFYFEKSKFMSIASTLGGVLNVILNLYCIRYYGFIAAGYTTLICYIFYAISHYYCMKKIINTSLYGIKIYNIKIILGISTILIVISAVMMMNYNNVIVRYVIILLIVIILIIKRNLFISILKGLKFKN